MSSFLKDNIIYIDPDGTSGELYRTKGLNGFNNPIPDVGDPVADQDASNKRWTEQAITTAISDIDFPSYSWQRVLERSSTSQQTPTGLDVPLKVEFGGAFSPPGGEVSISALGDITINQAAFYRICVVLNIGRTLGAGISDIYIRSLKNTNQLYFIDGNRLDDNNNFRTLNLAPIDDNFVANDVISYEIKRGAGGVNDGVLLPITDTGANPWGTLPSATVIIYRFVETIN